MEGKTESRQNFKNFNSNATHNSDAQDLIDRLKAVNVSLGYVRNPASVSNRSSIDARGKLNEEIGATKNMYA